MTKSPFVALFLTLTVCLVGYFGSPWLILVDVLALTFGAWASKMKRATPPRAVCILLSLLTAASGLWFVSDIILRQHPVVAVCMSLVGVAAPGMLGAGLARWNKGRIVARSRIPGQSGAVG